MKTCSILIGALLSLAGATLPAAEPPPPAITVQNLYPLSKLPEAQRVASALGKPVGFLLTWPMFFPGAKDFHANGSLSASYFYREFKDRAVLVNVDHTTGDLDHLPKAAADAFHSPAEGGYAPCLCLTDASGTRLVGMIPLWNNPVERELLFNQYRAVIADPHRWGEAAKRLSVVDAAAPANPAPASPAASTPPARASSSFAREMELTRQAEQQQAKAAPSP